MIEVYLDGIQLEVPHDISIGLSLGIADFTDPVTASGAYTQTVEIPRTTHNDSAFKFSGEILSAEQFNHAEHTARIVEDGCELIGGKAYLEGVSQRSYNLQVVGEEIEWVAKIRDKKLSELEGEAIGRYVPNDWSNYDNEGAVNLPKLSWVLLQHGCWFQEADDKKIRRSWITYHDLVPIVKLHTLLEHIFSHYEVVASDSLKELLHRTYTTMKWAQAENASILNEDMGFEVTSNLLNADSDSGELSVVIDADNPRPTMPLFDTVVEDKNEVIGYKLSQEGITTLSFSPKYDCVGSFELKTRYQTSIAFNTTTKTNEYGTWDDVATSGKPMFADQIIPPGTTLPFVQFDVKDSIEWRNKEKYIPFESKEWKNISLSHSNEALSFEDIKSASQPKDMSLAYIEVEQPDNFESIGYFVLYAWTNGSSDASYYFYRPTQSYVGKTNIVYSNLSKIYWETIKRQQQYTFYIVPALQGKDGKIYYARNMIANYGASSILRELKDNDATFYLLSTDQRLTFDVALQMPPQRFTEARSVPISELTFGSSKFGNEGSITVYGSAEGSLKPDFGWGVPIRSQVKLSDIGGETTAESMLRSIMQLYNLVVYTNPKTKQVFLYSFADYWNDNIVDWRDRIDADSDISTTYVGDSIGKNILLSFAEGSPRIDYYNDRHKLPYSAFKKALPNKMPTDDKEVQNETLTPPYMVRIKDEFGEGEGFIPAVALPDKDGDVLEFNLADVPNTLIMIDNSVESTNSMPPLNTAVFDDVGGIQPSIVATYGDTTLSFSDKDGKVGLHRYYDKQIALWEKAKRLTCYCRVEPWEIEALRYNSENINFRSLFRLNINGEDIYARLESLEYEPTNATNKCTFIIE